MLPPEERARLVVQNFKGDEFWIFNADAIADVAAAMTAYAAEAVAEERRICAEIAESFLPSGFTSDGKAGNSYAVARDDRARTIAAAIRARGEAEP